MDAMIETLHCFYNPIYFVETYLSEGRKLSPAQCRWLTDTSARVELGDVRDSRRTTTGLVYLLHRMIFEPYSHVIYSANQHMIDYARREIDHLYNLLPHDLQVPMRRSNRYSIELTNNSKMMFVNYNSDGAFRGTHPAVTMIDNIDCLTPTAQVELMQRVLPIMSLPNHKLFVSR